MEKCVLSRPFRVLTVATERRRATFTFQPLREPLRKFTAGAQRVQINADPTGSPPAEAPVAASKEKLRHRGGFTLRKPS